MKISDLPPDLVGEILSRVPATSLKRLRSSCKQWNTLFKDRRFAEKHFHNAPRESHVIMLKDFMLCPINVDGNVVPRSLEFKDEVRLKDFHSIKSEQVYIYNCFHCDGLLLCITFDRRLLVWNPCVGEIRWIQYNSCHGGLSRLVLGYENTKSGRTYKIMRYWKPSKTSGPVVEIYEFGSGSWRVLDDVTLGCYLEQPSGYVSIKGNTYCANLRITDDFLLCFDFTQERFKRMCLPQLSRYYGWNVLSVAGEEKLALLHVNIITSTVDMWVTNKIDTDTEAGLTWSKSFTLERSKWSPLAISFLLDEEKKMALFCSGACDLMIYMITEDERCYTSFPCKEESQYPLWWPFIFNYVPSLLQTHQ